MNADDFLYLVMLSWVAVFVGGIGWLERSGRLRARLQADDKLPERSGILVGTLGQRIAG